MQQSAARFLLWAGLWLALWTASFLSRPLWPIDETRYVSVAFEMWGRHDFLVPYLNGVPYSHKPPLLFWWIQVGWWFFGVNSWWPRLGPALFALVNLFLTAKLARLLWPDRDGPARCAPLILLGSILYAFFSSMVMFDMLLVSCTLVALIGLIRAWRGARSGWVLLGLGIGLGLLAKGPVILLHVLPVAALYPWWSGSPRRGWPGWYAGAGLGVMLGLIIALGWAVPAALSGGPDYADAILWGQTGRRVINSFAHRQPWWWYFPFLPLIFFPWAFWPALWRGEYRQALQDHGVRFCLAWMLPVFVLLCFVSGKQAYYLLPILPAFALLASRILETVNITRRDYALPGGLLALGGLAIVVGPIVVLALRVPDWIHTISPFWGLVFLVVALVPIVLAPRRSEQGAGVLAVSCIGGVVVALLGIGQAAAPDYDLEPVAQKIRQLQSQGYPVAHAGIYNGQYHFLGRLVQPLEVIHDEEIARWLAHHPNGRVVGYTRKPEELEFARIEFLQPYANKRVFILANPPVRATTLP
jgi:4-amino-4-deoxy-L-arabinose transferase-like glycosyltransferase